MQTRAKYINQIIAMKIIIFELEKEENNRTKPITTTTNMRT